MRVEADGGGDAEDVVVFYSLYFSFVSTIISPILTSLLLLVDDPYHRKQEQHNRKNETMGGNEPFSKTA